MDAYLRLVGEATRDHLGDRLVGLCAGGSIALGGYQLHESDIDVLGVVEAGVDPATLEQLAGALDHDVLTCPGYGLDFVLYRAPLVPEAPRVPTAEMSVTTGRHWAFTVGGSEEYSQGLLDLVVARKLGRSIVGGEPSEYIGRIPRGWLLEESAAALRWHLDRIGDDFHDPKGAAAVLNACRALYLAGESKLISKAGAGRWARSRAARADLIEDALEIRAGHRDEALDPGDVREFVESVLRHLSADPG